MKQKLLFVVAGLLLAHSALAQQPALQIGGAACVVAKWQGSVLDYEMVTGAADPEQARLTAEQRLAEKGFDRYKHRVDVRRPQASSALPHGHAVVLEANYKTRFGKPRRSIGCGFAPTYEDAVWAAMRDMQQHDWSWKPDRDGYDEIQHLTF